MRPTYVVNQTDVPNSGSEPPAESNASPSVSLIPDDSGFSDKSERLSCHARSCSGLSP